MIAPGPAGARTRDRPHRRKQVERPPGRRAQRQRPRVDTHNQPPARVDHVANAPGRRIAAVGQHMVAGADRELRQRFSRARPLGPRQLEEVARQRRQAHAVVQAPQRPARARFLHRRRIHGPDLERASGDDRQTLLLEQADTQRVQPTPWISSAASTAPRRTGPPDAPAGPEPPFPATSVRSRGAAGGSAGGCRPSCPCAAPSTPRCPAPTRASPEGRTTPAHPSPRPTVPASVSCIHMPGYAGHAAKTS